jgi:hypothetical protein
MKVGKRYGIAAAALQSPHVRGTYWLTFKTSSLLRIILARARK